MFDQPAIPNNDHQPEHNDQESERTDHELGDQDHEPESHDPEPETHDVQSGGTEGGVLSPSWRHTDSSDELSAAVCVINRAHLQLAIACSAELDDCVSDVQTRLGARLGLSEFRALTLADIGYTFQRFPSLAELGESGAYSLEIWRIVSEGLAAVSDEVAEAIESKVYEALSPTRHNQAMLGTKTIRRRIRDIVHEHEPSARPRDPDDDPLPPLDSERSGYEPSPRLDIDDRQDETTEFFLSLPKLEALELTLAIDNVRLKENCSRAEALMKMVRGQATAEINLNIYRRVDLPDSQIWAAGGWLSPMATKEWLKRVTHIQAPGKARVTGYAPSPLIRASVEGRDGTCRFPGCDVPAHECQLDHVKRYDHDRPESGGPTDTSNLHCLCHRHHNVKTTGAWDVTIEPDGTETWTSFGDGHTVITTPNGPLGRETFRHRAVRRTLTLAEYNRRREQRNQPGEPPF